MIVGETGLLNQQLFVIIKIQTTHNFHVCNFFTLCYILTIVKVGSGFITVAEI